MKVLVLNSGSSSVKYQLFEMPQGKVICSGMVDKIGEKGSTLTYELIGREKKTFEIYFSDHFSALNKVADVLIDTEYGAIAAPEEIDVVGHRVVHGGERFKATSIIDESVKERIKSLFSLAPLHNPPNYQGIEVAEQVFAKAEQVAVFDTAYHATLPEVAFRFSIPEKLYKEEGLRVYGFHGTSHRYVSREAINYLGLKEKGSKIITIHLGNGSSMAAILNGESIDTTMGLGPLGGLVMGTRSGDIDPSVIFYLSEKGYAIDDVKNLLNKESGMKGLAGENDMRAVNEMATQGDARAEMALEIYAYRIKKYIGAYAAAMNGLDAIVFTAGVGENDVSTRSRVCKDLGFLGLSLDNQKNEARGKGIQEIQSGPTRILVIPTNEELEIANQCYEVLN